MKSQQSAIQNLENQMGQMAQQMSNRPSGSLPSNTEQNPRGVNAIMLRSGKEVETAAQEALNKQEVHKGQEEDKKDKGKQKEEELKPKPPTVKPYVPLIPFPGRLKK